MDDSFLKFTFAIAEAYYFWHDLASQELVKYGLKGPHTIYLVGLYGHPEGLSMQDFNLFFFKDKSDVSRMMKILIDKGLVIKDSKYRAKYKLTPEGVEIAKKVVSKTEEIVDFARTGISKEDEDIFYNCLGKIIENLTEIAYKEKNK